MIPLGRSEESSGDQVGRVGRWVGRHGAEMADTCDSHTVDKARWSGHNDTTKMKRNVTKESDQVVHRPSIDETTDWTVDRKRERESRGERQD